MMFWLKRIFASLLYMFIGGYSALMSNMGPPISTNQVIDVGVRVTMFLGGIFLMLAALVWLLLPIFRWLIQAVKNAPNS